MTKNKLDCGKWEVFTPVDDLESTLCIASSLTLDIPEENIRIKLPNGEIL